MTAALRLGIEPGTSDSKFLLCHSQFLVFHMSPCLVSWKNVHIGISKQCRFWSASTSKQVDRSFSKVNVDITWTVHSLLLICIEPKASMYIFQCTGSYSKRSVNRTNTSQQNQLAAIVIVSTHFKCTCDSLMSPSALHKTNHKHREYTC